MTGFGGFHKAAVPWGAAGDSRRGPGRAPGAGPARGRRLADIGAPSVTRVLVAPVAGSVVVRMELTVIAHQASVTPSYARDQQQLVRGLDPRDAPGEQHGLRAIGIRREGGIGRQRRREDRGTGEADRLIGLERLGRAPGARRSTPACRPESQRLVGRPPACGSGPQFLSPRPLVLASSRGAPRGRRR